MVDVYNNRFQMLFCCCCFVVLPPLVRPEDASIQGSPEALFGTRKQDLPVRPLPHSSEEAEAELGGLSLWR